MTISFCSLQPAWEAHYAAAALTPPEGREMKVDEARDGRGEGEEDDRTEAGFDLFALLDQPVERWRSVALAEGREKVPRLGLLPRNFSWKSHEWLAARGFRRVRSPPAKLRPGEKCKKQEKRGAKERREQRESERETN